MGRFIQPGNTLTLTAPYNRLAAEGALIGTMFVVALNDVLNAAEGEFATDGVWELDKTSAQAWTQGARIYWDDTNKECTTVAAGNTLIGIAAEAADNPSDLGIVRLNGAVDEALTSGPATVLAPLTFGTNITAATANGALVDSSATNPTEAQFNELAKELGTKINAIITVLQNNGMTSAS